MFTCTPSCGGRSPIKKLATMVKCFDVDACVIKWVFADKAELLARGQRSTVGMKEYGRLPQQRPQIWIMGYDQRHGLRCRNESACTALLLFSLIINWLL